MGVCWRILRDVKPVCSQVMISKVSWGVHPFMPHLLPPQPHSLLLQPPHAGQSCEHYCKRAGQSTLDAHGSGCKASLDGQPLGPATVWVLLEGRGCSWGVLLGPATVWVLLGGESGWAALGAGHCVWPFGGLALWCGGWGQGEQGGERRRSKSGSLGLGCPGRTAVRGRLARGSKQAHPKKHVLSA